MKKLNLFLAGAAFLFAGIMNLNSQSVIEEYYGTASEKQTVFPDQAVRAMDAIPSGGLLLIPDSKNDRIMAFSPITGNLIDANFISPHDTLKTPKEVKLSGNGQHLLVSDQLQHVVFKFNLNGIFQGVFAPAGGPNTSVMDNIRGLEIRPNGNLLVSVADGPNASTVIEFNTSGGFIGQFMTGLLSPFDVLLRNSNYLVSDIHADKVARFGLDGSGLGDFAFVNTFPEQIFRCSSGNVLVGNFSGTQMGVLEFSSTGTFIGNYLPPGLSNFRGVYELPNGNILTTTPTGVYEIDRTGNIIDTKISNVSAQYITYISQYTGVPVSPYMILIVVAVIGVAVILRHLRINV